jgi:transposase
MQFTEDLSDRQAADAVRGRIGWKYALGLELDDSGFNFSALSEFRALGSPLAPPMAGAIGRLI